MIKKLLTITLSLMMIFTSFVPVFAEGEEVNIVDNMELSSIKIPDKIYTIKMPMIKCIQQVLQKF